MPAVINAPEIIDVEHVETYDLTMDQPQARKVRAGFWHTMTHRNSKRLTPTPPEQHTPACSKELHRFETPMDRFVREYPSLAAYALAIV